MRHPTTSAPRTCSCSSAPDGTEHRYRKIHPFSHADEERYVRAGTKFVTVDIDGLRCSLFVCYDLRFADEFWALAHDSDAYFVVANWPAKRRLHWSSLLRARAIENQAYVVGVNRVGSGGGLDYSGDSAIIDPLGEVLATGAGGETILFADLDPDARRNDPRPLPLPPRPPLIVLVNSFGNCSSTGSRERSGA